jgi:hypothetical protein
MGFAIANFSQYLYGIGRSGEHSGEDEGGQQLRDLGVWRLGYSPEESNPISRHASVALFGRDLTDARPIDS